ncbi:MAG TPA: glycosyltransferase [Acidobacteriota bacterium]|jgi:glycosyltransferase involved in cell wall biosynthesis|nr:glycosyltransferase [Acidobacteriota bacterium]
MKLNWFSPLPPARTEIANYTLRLLPLLSRQAHLTLWTDQNEWEEQLENYGEVRRYRLEQMPWADVNRGDVSIFHIGNNIEFHESIWWVSRCHAGLMILHDVCLVYLFNGLYTAQRSALEAYFDQRPTFFGNWRNLDGAASEQADPDSADPMWRHYPLTLLTLENALGAIVHTQGAFDKLKQENLWPVAYAPLPFSPKSCEIHSDPSTLHKSRAGGRPPFRLVIFGFLGQNRRLDAVLKALSDFSGRDQFHLDVYGELWNHEDVCAQIRSLGLEELVDLHGFVSDSELDAALCEAHMAINLRYPTAGEASASQLRIWAHALPSLVTKVGWYATLPSDAVAFVRPAHENTDIQSHLRDFLADPGRFARMGEKGRYILENEHTPDRYVQTILALAAKAEVFRPRAVSYRLAERVGGLMSDCMDANASEQAFRNAAAEIYTLTGKATKGRAAN